MPWPTAISHHGQIGGDNWHCKMDHCVRFIHPTGKPKTSLERSHGCAGAQLVSDSVQWIWGLFLSNRNQGLFWPSLTIRARVRLGLARARPKSS